MNGIVQPSLRLHKRAKEQLLLALQEGMLGSLGDRGVAREAVLQVIVQLLQRAQQQNVSGGGSQLCQHKGSIGSVLHPRAKAQGSGGGRRERECASCHSCIQSLCWHLVPSICLQTMIVGDCCRVSRPSSVAGQQGEGAPACCTSTAGNIRAGLMLCSLQHPLLYGSNIALLLQERGKSSSCLQGGRRDCCCC